MCLCEKENGHYKVSCVQGKCGTKKLVDHLQPLMTGEMKDVEVEWSIWDNVDTRNPKTGKAMTKRQVVLRKGTPQILVAELVEEVVFLSGHLFVAHWQQHQFAQLNKNVPLDCVVITADFAENYTCFQQNEIQGAHWAKDSVTVHPTVARYNCAECPGEVVEEVVDVVSDDLQHDTHSVHEFLNTVFKHLSNERQLNINKAYVLTDGCAAQYKCKTAFLDTSMSFDDFGFEMERGYYGSRHGKNRCDGEGGVIKSRVARAVTNGEAIVHNAERFFEVSKQAVEKKSVNPNGSCNHNRRTVLWVGSESINHDRQDRQCKTVPGTRKLHSVRGISKGSIKTRWLSCFCAVCTSESDLSPCVNRHIVGDWASVVIKTIPAARGQVAADIEPALDVQSAPDVQPAPVAQPDPDVQPVLVAQPDPGVQPVLVAQPDPGVQPVLVAQPDPDVQPVLVAQPDPGVQPVLVAQPDPDVQPAPDAQPDPGVQPVLVAQPDPGVQPVLVAQPDPDVQPVLLAQPDPGVQPVLVAQPDPDVQPVLVAQPDPGVQPAPDAQPDPDVQPVLVAQPDPGVKPVLVAQPDPGVKPVLVAQPDPDAQPVLVAQPDPGVQPAPDAQPAPNVQPAPDAQPDPDVQPVLVAQPDPDAQPVLVAQPDPDLEISFAASEISIDADVIMTELFEDNSFDINIEEMVEAVSNSGDPCVPTSSSCLPKHKTKYQVGDFIVVALLAGKRSINYVAEIKEITTDEEVLLQYMQEVGDNLYMWPSKTDVSQESLQSVVKKLPSPSLVVSKSSSRRQLFKF